MLSFSSSVFAHHAMEVHYIVQEEAIVTKSGVVKNFSLLDPHSYLVVSVEENGETQDWILEGRSRVMLTRSGWRFDMLKTGAEVRFSAFPARSGDTAGRILLLEIGDEVFCSDRCDLFDDLFDLESPEISAIPKTSTTGQLAQSF